MSGYFQRVAGLVRPRLAGAGSPVPPPSVASATAGVRQACNPASALAAPASDIAGRKHGLFETVEAMESVPTAGAIPAPSNAPARSPTAPPERQTVPPTQARPATRHKVQPEVQSSQAVDRSAGGRPAWSPGPTASPADLPSFDALIAADRSRVERTDTDSNDPLGPVGGPFGTAPDSAATAAARTALMAADAGAPTALTGAGPGAGPGASRAPRSDFGPPPGSAPGSVVAGPQRADGPSRGGVPAALAGVDSGVDSGVDWGVDLSSADGPAGRGSVARRGPASTRSAVTQPLLPDPVDAGPALRPPVSPAVANPADSVPTRPSTAAQSAMSGPRSRPDVRVTIGAIDLTTEPPPAEPQHRPAPRSKRPPARSGIWSGGRSLARSYVRRV